MVTCLQNRNCIWSVCHSIISGLNYIIQNVKLKCVQLCLTKRRCKFLGLPQLAKHQKCYHHFDQQCTLCLMGRMLGQQYFSYIFRQISIKNVILVTISLIWNNKETYSALDLMSCKNATVCFMYEKDTATQLKNQCWSEHATTSLWN